VSKRSYRFQLTGRIKPYVRMTRRGKWVNRQAQEYLASKDALGWQFAEQMDGADMLPGQTPLWVQIRVRPVRHTCDIDNIAKALMDSMNGVVFPDDRWVDVLTISRASKDADWAQVDVGVL
jgi:Holliday junction resolvase RusA-like endonuclease